MLLYPDGSCPACRKALPPANTVGRVFRDPKRLSQWLKWLLVVVALIHIFFGLCAAPQALLMNDMADGIPASKVLLFATGAKERRDGALGNFMSLVYFGAAFLFAFWTYRMNANIHALGGNNLRFTPAWAVSWYFVPVANLWKPYQVMRELWLASDNPANWQTGRTSKLLGWWWASWLASALSPFVAVIYMVRLSVQGDVLAPLMVIEVFGVVAAVLGLAAATLAFFVVARIGAFQEQAAERSLSAVFA